jgi:tRNA(adenine34) deaminase
LDKENSIPAKKPKRWVKNVTADSTHPPEGLFNRNAATIARSLASKKVSPKGPGSGMRMLTYYINRAGRNLSAGRRAELEKAKALLSKWVAQHKEKEAGKRRDAA